MQMGYLPQTIFAIVILEKHNITCAACSSVEFLLLVWTNSGLRDDIAGVRGQCTPPGFPVVQYAAARVVVTVRADDTTHVPSCLYYGPGAVTSVIGHGADVRHVNIRIVTALWEDSIIWDIWVIASVWTAKTYLFKVLSTRQIKL